MKAKRKITAAAICLLLAGTLSFGGTLAYLITQSEALTNTFHAPNYNTTIDEKFENNVKENVAIQNTGDADAYVRAAVIILWKCGEEVHSQIPVAGEDYSITWNTNLENPNNLWFLGSDGFYYYKQPVPAGEKTQNLINKCTVIAKGPVMNEKEYTLSVDIVTQAVQSEPATAVTEAWGVTVDADGTLSK